MSRILMGLIGGEVVLVILAVSHAWDVVLRVGAYWKRAALSVFTLGLLFCWSFVLGSWLTLHGWESFLE